MTGEQVVVVKSPPPSFWGWSRFRRDARDLGRSQEQQYIGSAISWFGQSERGYETKCSILLLGGYREVAGSNRGRRLYYTEYRGLIAGCSQYMIVQATRTQSFERAISNRIQSHSLLTVAQETEEDFKNGKNEAVQKKPPPRFHVPVINKRRSCQWDFQAEIQR